MAPRISDKLFFWLAAAAIVIVTLVIYSNSFNAPFFFDDGINITGVTAIRDMRNFTKIIKLTERPLTNYTFALNYFFGKLNVFGYHLLNIIIHIFCGITVLLFVFFTLNLPGLKEKYGSCSRWMAFFAAVIFVAHPVKTEAVTYITQRAESLASLFYLLSMVFFLLSLRQPNRERWFKGAAIIASLLGMATKPIVATLPFTLLLYDWLFVARWRWVNLRKRVRFHVGMFLTIPLVVLLAVHLFTTHVNDKSIGFGNPNLPSPLHYFFTELRVLVYYLKPIFLPLPANLNVDIYFPASKGFFDQFTFLAFLVLCLILTVALLNLKKRPLLAFFILWYFIILLPTSSIMPIEDVACERRVYLASLGWSILLLLALRRMKPSLRFSLLGMIVILLSAWTYQRNIVWADQFTLWHDAIKKSPLKSRSHVNLGMLYLGTGNVDKAEGYIREALRLDPEAMNANVDLGLIYLIREDYDAAILQFKKVLGRNPDYEVAHSNLGVIYRRKGLLDEAEREFKEVLRISPDAGEVRANLGSIYAQKAKYKEAIAEFKQAIELNPDIPEPHLNLGLIYLRFRQGENAITEFKQAVALNPNYSAPHYNLALTYLALGQIEEAKKELAILEHLDLKLAQKLKSHMK